MSRSSRERQSGVLCGGGVVVVGGVAPGIGEIESQHSLLGWGLGTYPACELLQVLASFLAIGQTNGNGFNDSGPFCLR